MLYIQLPPTFLDYYVELTGDGPSKEVTTHCRQLITYVGIACATALISISLLACDRSFHPTLVSLATPSPLYY